MNPCFSSAAQWLCGLGQGLYLCTPQFSSLYNGFSNPSLAVRITSRLQNEARNKVLNICISNSSFLPRTRYRGQCFRALDSGNNQDTRVCPGDLTHHRLPPEQASHYHRAHQAGQRGGQVRDMMGSATVRGRWAGREAAQNSVSPNQPPPVHSPTRSGVELCILETTSCPLMAPARNTAHCLRPPSSWPAYQKKCDWRSCLHLKVVGP